MKKNLLFIFTLAFVFANAQFTDDIESYPVGPVHSGQWTSWDGTTGAIDGIVSEDIAVSGTKSILIAEGSTQDCMLSFINGTPDAGQITAGTWYFDFKMYIPSGSTAYFNLQNIMPAGTEFNFHCNFNEGGAANGNATLYQADGTNSGQGTVMGAFSYPSDTWFPVSFVFDLDNVTIISTMDGNEVYNGAFFTGGTVPGLGGIDFFSIDGSNRYYVDDVRFDTTAPASLNDLETLGFTAYPNPVQDKLYLNANENITSVSIFNVIGQEVKRIQPNSLSPTIDVSDLNSGAYFVKVNIGDTTGTIKIIK